MLLQFSKQNILKYCMHWMLWKFSKRNKRNQRPLPKNFKLVKGIYNASRTKSVQLVCIIFHTYVALICTVCTSC